MDVYCRRCGEPWGFDSLHEEADGSGRSFGAVSKDFRANGCRAFTSFGPLSCEPADDVDPRIGLMYDLLGSDLDGAAAMLEDLGYLS
jgi:hypothetical protein